MSWSWELHRYRASRLFWLQALGFFGLILLVMRLAHNDTGYRTAAFTFNGSVAITSPWGLVSQLPSGLLLMLCFVLPFVNADGVSRDLSRRTHELLMTTPLPNWAYVWGRYLVGLLMSLGLALLLLAAILGLGLLWHLTASDVSLARAWSGAAALGRHGHDRNGCRQQPQLCSGYGVPAAEHPGQDRDHAGLVCRSLYSSRRNFRAGTTTAPSWYVNWDPTSGATKFGLLPQYQSAWQSQLATATSLAQAQRIFVAVENMVPGNLAWLAPHLILAAGSLLLVLLAALSFQRFRNALAA